MRSVDQARLLFVRHICSGGLLSTRFKDAQTVVSSNFRGWPEICTTTDCMKAVVDSPLSLFLVRSDQIVTSASYESRIILACGSFCILSCKNACVTINELDDDLISSTCCLFTASHVYVDSIMKFRTCPRVVLAASEQVGH
ncbi:hypothetical protein BLNAU_4783 [Blattamonas nauphoetae]|uniref:Uncharacterized protein n=1 Tax=Blattamonas nauphoetae TaxID=2049346 RepID=A0ABQ9Y950_9EUKA|nr:hypothetical protein BLNAU_4783 [Blattamonas nauphoetae]